MGAIAVPCNIAAAVFLTGNHTNSPAKVAAFACAVLYLNSGLTGPLLDTTVYSPLQRTPRLLRRIRPMIWLVFVFALAAVVAASQEWGSAWPTDALPYAYLVCLLPYALGLRIREYERALGAAGAVVAQAQSDSNRRVAHDMHELLQTFKVPLQTALNLDGLDPSSRMGLITFMNNVRVIYDNARNHKIDLQSGIMPPLEHIVRNICNPASAIATTNIQIDKLDEANSAFAKQLISTLTHNAVQAYEREFKIRVARTLEVQAHVIDDRINIVVTDRLVPIPENLWCLRGSTIGFIRDKLRQQGGDLRQIPLASGGKSIQADWNVQLATLRNGPESKRNEKVTS